jgi:hypothetical protein
METRNLLRLAVVPIQVPHEVAKPAADGPETSAGRSKRSGPASRGEAGPPKVGAMCTSTFFTDLMQPIA